jgi:putative spermidine/putrescine transport system substrate-binding protein
MKRWAWYGRLCALLVGSVLLAACGGGGTPIAGKDAPAATSKQAAPAKTDEKVKVTMFIWAGSNQGVVPREVVAEYLKTHPNVEIEFLESTNAATYPKMVASRKTTPDQPLVHFGFINVSSLHQGIVDDLWEEMNFDNIPNGKNTLQSMQRPDKKGVPYQMSTMGLMYNKDRVTEPPTSWADLWSEKYRGRVVAFDYQWQALILAARLNGGDENNIDPGFQIWSQNAKNFKALVNTNDAVKNLVTSGDAWLAPWFASQFRNWSEEGAPLGFVNPKEGPIAFPLYLEIMKGVTPAQRTVAEEVINMLLAPEAAGRYAELTYSIPFVNNAVVSDKVKNDPLFTPLLAEQAIQLDWEAMARHNADWKERWDKEVKSKLE